MTEDSERKELANNIVMLFDSALHDARMSHLRPNVLITAPPEHIMSGADEWETQGKLHGLLKLRQLARALKSAAPTRIGKDAFLSEAASDMVLWNVVAGYVWARDHDASAILDQVLKGQPSETGIDKFTAEDCQAMQTALIEATKKSFADNAEITAKMAPFGGWLVGKRLWQFEQDGAVVAALLSDIKFEED